VFEPSQGNLVALCSLEDLHWCFVSESVVEILGICVPDSRMVVLRDTDDLNGTAESENTDFVCEKGKLLAKAVTMKR
jgi:hypothetical protein